MSKRTERVSKDSNVSTALRSPKATGESDLHRESSTSFAHPGLVVKNAHTGQTQAYQSSKISVLRDAINSRWNIQPENQLLLNVQGQQLRGSDTLTEDLYVFDKTLSCISSDEKLYSLDFEPYKPPPTSDAISKNMTQIRQALQNQRDWSQKAMFKASDIYGKIEMTYQEILVIIDALGIASKYQTRQSKATESVFNQVLNYAVGSSRLLQNSNWQSVSSQLDKIHVIGSKEEETLASWLDFGQVRKRSLDAETISKLARSQMRDLKSQVDSIIKDTDQLTLSISKYSDSQTSSMESTIKRHLESAAVSLQSIQSLRAKLESDATENLPSTELEANKVMMLHQTELLPCSLACIEELAEIYRQVEKLKRARQQETKQMYTRILNLQEQCTPIRPSLSRVEVSLQNMSDMVQFLHDVETLPFSYGAALIETIARREWLDQLRLLASEAAEDIGKAREEEEKRRKKWIAAFPQNFIPSKYAPVYEQDSAIVPTIDIDLNVPGKNNLQQVDDKDGHSITRGTVSNYIDTLAKIPGQDKASNALREIIQNLGRRQSKRYFQLFANNSLATVEHQAEGMKRQSGGADGDEGFQDERDLQRENVALSSKIKSYESRIRKLEDLLHKHSWRSGNDHISFNHYHQNVNSQHHPNSKPSVRRNSNEPGSASSGPTSLMSDMPTDVDQQELLSRLMAQLNNERQANASLRKKLATVEVNVEEIERTKNDLLANLAGQDSAFVNERKSLLQDMAKLSNQQEILEEENERFEEQNRLLECEYEEKLSMKNQELAEAKDKILELTRQVDKLLGLNNKQEQKGLDEIEERLCEINGSVKEEGSDDQQIDRLNQLVDNISSLVVGPSLPIMKRRLSSRTDKARDLTQRLFTSHMRMQEVLGKLGFAIVKEEENNTFHIVKLPKDTGTLESQSQGDHQHKTSQDSSALVQKAEASKEGLEMTVKALYWISQDNEPGDTNNNNNNKSIKDYDEGEDELYQKYLASIRFDYDLFSEAIRKRVRDAEHLARKWRKEGKSYRDQAQRAMQESWYKISFRGFKVGDLVLFLPTRNRNNNIITAAASTHQHQPWAAFNIGAPHYFLREDSSHQLKNRDWLLGRISKVEERVVDRRRKQQQDVIHSSSSQEQRQNDNGGDDDDDDDDNPFDLDDGLRWYLLDAVEEKGSISPQHMYRAWLAKESASAAAATNTI